MEGNSQVIIKNILLCIDGEQWTEKAINYAIGITRAFNGRLTVLHVINPYLKKFADEIYAVGRIEYRDHIDKELRKEAEDIIAGFKSKADSAGLLYDVILRCGTPEEEIIREISQNPYDLLIIGNKPRNTLKEKMESFNLPKKVFKNTKIPTLFVR